MTVDERIEALVQRHEALTMTLELLTRDVQDLKIAAQQDGENIRARLTRLEGDNG
jgi:phage-related minor tail protein